MDAAAARRLNAKVAIAVMMAWAGLAFAGCETGVSLFGSSPDLTTQTAAAPQQTTAQPPIAKVAVAPVIGAPDAVAKQIQQEFTAAAEKQRIAVTQGKDEHADYTLRGYVVAAKEKSATKVSYIWDVTDPAGKRVNRITGEELVSGNASKDPWAAVSASVAQSIAGKAAATLAGWIPTHGATAAVATNTAHPAGAGAPETPAAQRATPRVSSSAAIASAATATSATTTGSITRGRAVTAVVPAVTGAPGDGSSSLTQAIQRELAGKGITVADKSAGNAYRVEGTVNVGQARDGKQPVQIEWLVRDPQGKKLGTVSQKNEIPEGSLDGAWGKTAEQAAGAAAQGIIKLLPQQSAVN
jgi:hypothetical protein